MNIIEAFELPSRDDITALGFVVRLETQSSDATNQKLVDDYVLTPKVREELPHIFEGLHQSFLRGEDCGRFVHGSFGSGKSHFLSIMGLLLESADVAWRKPDPDIQALGRSHRAWVRDANLLAIRVHMLTAAQGAGFDRALYEAFNKALARHGKPPFEFLNVDGVLAEVRREAEQFGDALWTQLDKAGVLGSSDDFEAIARGSLDEREEFARAWLAFKQRDPATAGINPNWAEGLQRLTRHAKAHGFGGVVFLVDELLLWLSEKSAAEFKAAINQLVVLVDHADGQRAVPVFAFVARQRSLKEFFPDLVQEDALYEHIDHHAKRFELTQLQDVELRHICKERVLKRRHAREVQAVVDKVAEDNKRLLPTLLHGADPGYIRDVYPFHPALIEMLIDVSSLMQRERTALRLLYELLVIHNPELALGKFIPVGRAFDALFPESGVDSNKRPELGRIHKAYYQRFRPAMRQLELPAERERVLDALVKTVLLSKVSPRLSSGGLTVEKLVHLNDVEVVGETQRGRVMVAHQELVALSRVAPALQLSGSGGAAQVNVELEGASLADVLDAARSRADNGGTLRDAFYKLLATALKLDTRKGVRAARPYDYTLTVEWRGTPRKGSLVFCNIREQPDTAFSPQDNEEFRLLVDYPWDEPGHTAEEDRQRARNVRKARGNRPTACWLPRHLTPTERAVLVDIAAVQLLREGPQQEELLGNLAAADQARVLEQAATHEDTQRRAFDQVLRDLYKDSGQVESLLGTGSAQTIPVAEPELSKNVDAFASALLDRRYPDHPDFKMEPRPADLQTLCDWMVRASESADTHVPFEEEQLRPLRDLGIPLDVVDVGSARARLKRDARFLKLVLDDCKGETAPWNAIDSKLALEPHGLLPAVRNLLLAFVARSHSFRLVNGAGETVESTVDGKAKGDLTLRRAPLVTPAEWSRLRELVPELSGLPPPPSHRTLTEQDKALRALREAAQKRHGILTGLHQRLQTLKAQGDGRLGELREVMVRLKPLLASGDDSAAALRELLRLWPDDAADPLRAVLKQAESMLAAVAGLDEPQLHNLEAAGDKPGFRAHLEGLRVLLGGGTLEYPLTAQEISRWNARAAELVKQLLSAPQPQPPVPGPGPLPQPPPPGARALLTGVRVDAADPRALERFWETELRPRLAAAAGVLDVDVTVKGGR